MNYSLLSVDKQQELLQNFRLFLETKITPEYLKNEVQWYLKIRQQGVKNFNNILRLFSRFKNREQVTEGIFLKLLPYHYSEQNQDKEAWVHYSPVFWSDAKKELEQEYHIFCPDWELLAQDILDFVSHCNRSPEQLSEKCQTFLELPYSQGFTMEIVSPILNALKPQNFLLINQEVKQLMDYFNLNSSTNGLELKHYPTYNKLLLRLITFLYQSELRPTLATLQSSIIPHDLFTLFCAWFLEEKSKSANPFISQEDHKVNNINNSKTVFPQNVESEINNPATTPIIPSLANNLENITNLPKTKSSPIPPIQPSEVIKPSETVSPFIPTTQSPKTKSPFIPDPQPPENDPSSISTPQSSEIKPLFIPNTQPLDNNSSSTSTPHPLENNTNVETPENGEEETFLPETNPRQSLFTPETFRQLSNGGLLTSFVLDKETEKIVIQPFLELLDSISQKAPNIITDLKDDGQNKYRWNPPCLEAYFSLGGLLLLSFHSQGLEIGFKISSRWGDALDDARFNMNRNYQSLQLPRVKTVIDYVLDDNSLSLGKLRLKKSSYKGYNGLSSQFYLLERAKLLRLSLESLTTIVFEVFKRLYPLVLMTVLDKAEPAILEYLDSQDFTKTIIEQNPKFSLRDLTKTTYYGTQELNRWLNALHRKGQIILQGSPGTGKTFLAENMAKHLVSGEDGFYDIVQFHSCYTYEDFIQGIKPETNENGQLEYPVKAGKFLQFCEKASQYQGVCVLIIDEINRANLSQVFGELMYLLEYRDRDILLAGSHQSFKIPANVRIIGTMNTADRSIALVDHALRRRFAFITLTPNYDALRKYHQNTLGVSIEGLIDVLKQINKMIYDSHYALGISFFLRVNLAEEIEDIWLMEIEPYLEEFFFDQPSKIDGFRWDKIKQTVMITSSSEKQL